jgi:hypothetical protein
MTCPSIEELIALVQSAASIAEIERRFGHESVELDGPDYANVELRECGVGLVLDRGAAESGDLAVRAVHLFRDAEDGHRQFHGVLPCGVRFGATRVALIRDTQPSEMGGGESYRGRLLPLWVRYRLGTVVMHVEFDRRDVVRLVTLMHETSHVFGPATD